MTQAIHATLTGHPDNPPGLNQRVGDTLPPASVPADGVLTCALAVVVEAQDDRRGYWALAHPPGKPDFHHRGGFSLCLDRTQMRA